MYVENGKRVHSRCLNMDILEHTVLLTNLVRPVLGAWSCILCTKNYSPTSNAGAVILVKFKLA